MVKFNFFIIDASAFTDLERKINLIIQQQFNSTLKHSLTGKDESPLKKADSDYAGEE